MKLIQAELYPIADCPVGKLAIMPRPRAGDWLPDEVASWRRQGMNIVVSLLDDDEIAELDLTDESECCHRVDIRFIRFPIPDRDVPQSMRLVAEFVCCLVLELRAGKGVGIHCRMGVGRSAMLAACVLSALGVPLQSAWASVQNSRGLSVPDTPAQREWVQEWFSRFSANEGFGPKATMGG